MLFAEAAVTQVICVKRRSEYNNDICFDQPPLKKGRVVETSVRHQIELIVNDLASFKDRDDFPERCLTVFENQIWHHS